MSSVEDELRRQLEEEKERHRRTILDLGFTKAQLAEKEALLKELVPMLCIRKKIEVYESLFAPELRDPQSVFRHTMFRTTNQVMDFHEAKWRIILTKTHDARIVRLRTILSSAAISEDIFCRTIGSFFPIASVNIHLPELNSYNRAEMGVILRTKFSINDDTTIRCITDVLMEM